MALTTTITVKSVVESQKLLFIITLNMLYKEDETVLVDEDFTEKYRTGEALSAIYFRFLEKMKAAIASYKAEQVVINSVGLSGILTNLNTNVGT